IMSLMRRWAILVLALGAVALPTTAHASVLLQPRACPGCGTLSVPLGTGTLYQWDTGLFWGGIQSGTIDILDRSNYGTKDWSVIGYDQKPFKRSDGRWVFQGSNMIFTASTSFFVKLQGSGISVSSVATGTATVSGRGEYHLNGGRKQSWPSAPRTLKLQG
ncbi:MAG: hypothetical protein ACXVYV_00200, partial [Gaiellales bacterium]